MKYTTRKIKGGYPVNKDSNHKEALEVISFETKQSVNYDYQPPEVKKTDRILINLVPDDLFNLPLDQLETLMGMPLFLAGVKRLKDIGDITILVDKRNRELADRLVGEGLIDGSIHLVKSVYPIAMALYKGLDGKKPYDLIMSYQEVVHYGGYTKAHYVLIAGNAFTKSVLVKTQLGQPIEEVVNQFINPAFIRDKRADASVGEAYMLVENSAIGGSVLTKDCLVEPLTNVVIALDQHQIEKEKASPCINCGACSTVCPAGLIPSLLYKHHDKKLMSDTPIIHSAVDCIGCHLCDYICPSKISLAKNILELKTILTDLSEADVKEVKE